MDNMVEARGSPSPRRHHVVGETLDENPAAAQHGVAVKPPRHHQQPHWLSRHRQVRQTPRIPAVNPRRSCPHPGQAPVSITARTVIIIASPSAVASSTTKPGGTKLDARRARRIALILS
jgi:hypothetical protein